MTYDEFASKLDKTLVEFKRANGRDMTTIQELKVFLDRRLQKPKSKGLRKIGNLLG